MSNNGKYSGIMLENLGRFRNSWAECGAKKQLETDNWPDIQNEIHCLLGMDFDDANVDDLFACSEAIDLALSESYFFYMPRLMQVIEKNSSDERSQILFESFVFLILDDAGHKRLMSQLAPQEREGFLSALGGIENLLFGSTESTSEIRGQS